MRYYKKMLDYEKQQLIRIRRAIDRSYEDCLEINGKKFKNFTSNDYLGIRSDQRVKEALIEGVKYYGLGSSSSAQVSGYHTVHQQLEEEIANFLGREKAIYFGSGYLANIGTITALTGRSDMICFDKRCHASIVDAVILSRVRFKRYRHNKIGELNQLLQNSSVKHKFVVCESIFSMEGSELKIPEVLGCTKNTATLIMDDAHGSGILGERGAGICEKYALSELDVPVLITGLGAAFGSYGAVVSGKKEIVDAICQFARTYMYSIALPPIIPFATLRALEIIRKERWRREKLVENIQHFIEEAKIRNLTLISDDETPIKSIIMRDVDCLIKTIAYLKRNNFYISGIRPPSVPKNTARLRISLNSYHSKCDISTLLNMIYDCSKI